MPTITSTLNHLRTISSRNCPPSGKILESILFYPSSLSSTFIGLQSPTALLWHSYHKIGEDPQNPNTNDKNPQNLNTIGEDTQNPRSENPPSSAHKWARKSNSYHTIGEDPQKFNTIDDDPQNPNTIGKHPQNPSSENPPSLGHKWARNFNSLTPRCPTPMGTQFESSIKKLQPGFDPQAVAQILQQQTDPELALDIFRWTALQRNYKHNHQTYQIMIQILFSARRTKPTQKLMEQVMEGACIGSLSLFNTIIETYCKLRMMGPAINVYKKMQRVSGCKPNLRTYNLLLNGFLRRFSSFTVCCVHLRSVKSLYQQMAAAGVDPDVVTLNLLIKAHSKALEMHEALRFFREMGLYGCRPDVNTFNYMIGGFCQKGWSEKALEFYERMVKEGFFPNRGVCSVLVCSLSVDGKVEDGIKVLKKMTDRGLVPDFLAYRTLVDELGRIGNEQEAFELLEGLRKRRNMLDQRTYGRLVNVLKQREEERVL